MPRFVAPLSPSLRGALEEPLSSSHSTSVPESSSQARLRPPLHPLLRQSGSSGLGSATGAGNTSRTSLDEDVTPLRDEDGEGLSEEQLRALYDSEEIDRFLNLFSAYVSEVRLPGGPSTQEQASVTPDLGARQEQAPLGDSVVDEESSESYDWVSLQPRSRTGSPPSPPRPWEIGGQDLPISRQIAIKYIVPYLPPTSASRPTFTLGRFRLATQRLYLAVAPPYERVFLRIGRLATWQRREVSLRYCALFWFLWYQNLLLPAFFVRVLYALIRRKVFAYPSLSELRERRREVGRARAFGKEVETRLAAPPTIAVNELWRFVKLAAAARLTASAKVSNIRGTETSEEQEAKEIRVQDQNATTVLEKDQEQKDVDDIKSIILSMMDEVSDLHERLRNLFLWRQPQSSWMFVLVLFVLCIVTTFVPAKYLAKAVYGAGGIIFWHVVPIIGALTDAERERLPPPLHTVPTDADYAMDLISQRVARGLDVRPSNKRHRSSSGASTPAGPGEQPGNHDNNAKWKKWGERAAKGKAWIEGSRGLLRGQEWSRTGSWPPPGPLIPNLAFVHSTPQPYVETHTFPAQHAKAPGLITLTPTSLFFTPLMSSTAKVAISLAGIRAVKKAGPMKGLDIRWIDQGDEKVDRFTWIGGRDELFARLVGWQGRRWIRM